MTRVGDEKEIDRRVVTLYLTEEEHRAFKMACASFGYSMNAVLRAQALRVIEQFERAKMAP